MLVKAAPATSGLWPRAAAFLGRQALEDSIGNIWRQHQPEMLSCSARAQLLALADVTGNAEIASRARYTWTALSRACHHHAYELAPTESELSAWLDDVESIIRGVGE